MDQKIPDLLKSLEKDLKITILFAVEVGSRAWELNSAESDYDVRFVFYRSLEDYISITKFDEQISLGYDKDLNSVQKEGAYIEMTGFDIFKYFKLLSSCNVTAIDWVNSNIVYMGNKNELMAFIEKNANMPKIFVQYFCTARGAHKAHIASKELNVKKYLHVMHLILYAEYILKFKRLPNTSMVKNLQELEKEIPKDVLEKIYELVKLKKNGHGKDNVKEIAMLDKYYLETFERYQNLHFEKKIREEKNIDIDYLNKYLQKLIIKNEK